MPASPAPAPTEYVSPPCLGDGEPTATATADDAMYIVTVIFDVQLLASVLWTNQR